MFYNEKYKFNNNLYTVIKTERFEHGGLFLLSEASKKCSYTQEYLSLLARRGELKAVKKQGKWYTSDGWLENYIFFHSSDLKGNVKGKLRSVSRRKFYRSEEHTSELQSH